MRGTASHDVEFSDVFVPADKVLANRPSGVVDGSLHVIISHAFPVISAVYLGVAEAARDHAVAAVTDSPRAEDASVQRMIGFIDNKLRTCGWALDGALRIVGEDPTPSDERVAAVMAAKRTIEPLEEVALLRDEMANLVWGVERVVQTADGRPVNRNRQVAKVSLRQQVPGDLGDAAIVYRLMTPVPDNWVRLADEEVPCDGAVVTRRYQLARTPHGGTAVWIGRRKRFGDGEGWSGLRFDIALPPGSA